MILYLRGSDVGSKLLSKQVGQRMQEKRKELDLTQEQMAERIGISQQSLSSMERGIIAPKFERLPDIAKTLKCPVPALFENGEGKEGGEFMGSEVSDLIKDLDAEERAAILEIIARMAHVFKVHRQSDRA